MLKNFVEKIVKNIPNTLTLSRGVLSPILLPFLFFNGNVLGTLITIVSLGATDLIDGGLARILKAESEFGKKIDPICDKILGIISLTLCGIMNPIMFSSLAFETSIALVGGLRYLKEKDKVYVIKIGKIKSSLLIINIISCFLASLFPIFIPIQVALFIITSTLQAATLYENIKKLVEKQPQEIKTIIKEEEKNEDDKEEEKEKKFTLKDKYISLKNEMENLVSSKENNERNLGNKIEQRNLRKNK